MKYQAGILTLIVGIGLTVFQNCAGTHDVADGAASSESVSGSASGMAAFQSGFYAFTQTQNCAQCHGVSQVPLFAVSNVASAYSAFTSLVDPNNPTGSVIITYSGNGHCGVAACSAATSPPQVSALIASWAAAVNAAATTTGPVTPSGAVPKYLTPTMPLPATIPAITVATPGVVRFSLAGLKIASLSTAILEVEIQKVNATEYRVNRVKIDGNTAAVAITGIHVFLKPQSVTAGIGLEDMDQGAQWTQVSATAAVSTLPKTLPVGPLAATPLSVIALEIQQQSAADAMTIGIDTIQ